MRNSQKTAEFWKSIKFIKFHISFFECFTPTEAAHVTTLPLGHEQCPSSWCTWQHNLWQCFRGNFPYLQKQLSSSWFLAEVSSNYVLWVTLAFRNSYAPQPIKSRITYGLQMQKTHTWKKTELYRRQALIYARCLDSMRISNQYQLFRCTTQKAE